MAVVVLAVIAWVLNKSRITNAVFDDQLSHMCVTDMLLGDPLKGLLSLRGAFGRA